MRFSSSETATRQLRTSPGGSMPSSRRKRPLEPPSSLTVTSAVRSEMKTPSGWASPARTVYCLRPLSKVERPVPPPMATTRIPRAERPRFCSPGDGMRAALALPLFGTGRWQICRLRIQQLSEARIVRHVLEVRVVACLEAVLRIQTDGFAKVFQRAFHLAGETIHHGQAVIGKIGPGIALEYLFHVSARLIKLAAVQERNCVIKVLFVGFKAGGGAGKLLIAQIQMDAGAIHEFAVPGGKDLLQEGLGFLEFVLLHRLDSTFIVLHSLCKTRVFSEGRFMLWVR